MEITICKGDMLDTITEKKDTEISARNNQQYLMQF